MVYCEVFCIVYLAEKLTYFKSELRAISPFLFIKLTAYLIQLLHEIPSYFVLKRIPKRGSMFPIVSIIFKTCIMSLNVMIFGSCKRLMFFICTLKISVVIFVDQNLTEIMLIQPTVFCSGLSSFLVNKRYKAFIFAVICVVYKWF